jgi:hypothetical protein
MNADSIEQGTCGKEFADLKSCFKKVRPQPFRYIEVLSHLLSVPFYRSDQLGSSVNLLKRVSLQLRMY